MSQQSSAPAAQRPRDRVELPEDRDTRIPLLRLVGVELRKLTDTRAGFWLLVSIGIITVLAILLTFLSTSAQERTFTTFVAATGMPQGILLPVLGILLVTSEWSQRTAMVTFSLVPSRPRVLVAKVLAALVFGLAALAIALAVAALAALVGGAENPFSDAEAGVLLRLVAVQLAAIGFGLGFGLLLLSSAAAIVLYFVVLFVVPGLLIGLVSLVESLESFSNWVNPTWALAPTDPPSGGFWPHFVVSLLVWAGIPLALGTWRLLRAEVK